MMNREEPTDPISVPRLVIAGIHSDCGKTTITRGLMAALVKRGMVVQPFKIGPDFIDPSHHTRICGRISRTLDPIMMGEEGVRETLLKACKGADIAVIEGVMGLYDGVDGTREGSTALTASLIDAPVILVIPVKGMSGSVHAIANGFRDYDPAVSLKGVILNMVGSPRHREMLTVGKTIDQFGFLPFNENLQMESRHLGLHMGEETRVPEDLAALMETSCDIPGIIRIARSAPPVLPVRETDPVPENRVRIAIAQDAAFCFYYQDNIDRLRNNGAEIAFFSPMAENLPPADLLYLGGGYPELYARDLEAGKARDQIRRAGDDGLPVYGECGGLMYLGEGLDGGPSAEKTRWTGLLPGSSRMERRFQALGYSIGTCTGGPSVGPAGVRIRGHEFHYSRFDPGKDARFAIHLTRGTGIARGEDGLFVHNCMGSYTHAYFSQEFAESLISAAARYQRC